MPITVDGLQADASSTNEIATDRTKSRPKPKTEQEGEQQPHPDNQEPTVTATTEEGEAIEDEDGKLETATLSHILTNAVILYEFLLELSAIVQVRGSLFEEAGFLDLDLQG